MTFKSFIPLLSSLFFVASACQSAPVSSFDYLGETPPGNVPVVFAPGLISQPNRWEGNAVFSPDGTEFLFNVFEGEEKSIYSMVRTDNGWSEPAPIASISDHPNWEPFISLDGTELYFVSSRFPGNPEWNGRIWKSVRRGDSWSSPGPIDLGHETEDGYWFPNVSKSGSLYFGGTFPDFGNLGQGDGYVRDGKTGETKNIEAINTEHREWDPYVMPDEKTIFWASDRPGGYGETDLYVSFRNSDTADWGTPINLGPEINTDNYEVAPRLSPDLKYLFFDRPIDGTQDIYWVSLEKVMALNPEIPSDR